MTGKGKCSAASARKSSDNGPGERGEAHYTANYG
jgi:hypothetical protein